MRSFPFPSDLILIAALCVTGCATLSNDHGFGNVKEATRTSIGKDIAWPRTDAEQAKVSEAVDSLLRQPIDVEDAVQIALLNNKDLQGSFYDLGISEADMVQSSKLSNPKLSVLYAKHGEDYKIEESLTFNILSLVTMPKMREIQQQHYEATKKSVTLKVVGLAYATRIAFFEAVSANESLNYAKQVMESAEASAEFARRMMLEGNWGKLEQERQQLFYEDAKLEYSNTLNERNARKERLSRLLGISADQLKLQDRLPSLPDTPPDDSLLGKDAFENRIDLIQKREETLILAKQLGLSKTTRLINVLEIGPARVLEGHRQDAYKNGVDLSFELPLFDWGEAKVARAESIYMKSVNQTAQLAINARSEIRESFDNYATTYSIAKQYRDEIVPLRKKILDENQLRYNGMLISPFELMAEARTQVMSVNNYIAALRNFWIADIKFKMALLGDTSGMDGD